MCYVACGLVFDAVCNISGTLTQDGDSSYLKLKPTLYSVLSFLAFVCSSEVQFVRQFNVVSALTEYELERISFPFA